MAEPRQASRIDGTLTKFPTCASVLRGPSSTEDASDSKAALHRIFERHLQGDQKVAKRLAVVYNERSLTFSELNTSANRMARGLLHQMQFFNKNVLEGPILIGVSLPPSERLVIVLLAILKSGAAYLPLDATFPRGRIQHILEESNPVLVVRESQGRTDSEEDLLKSIAVDYDDLVQVGSDFCCDDLTENECLAAEVKKRSDIACVLYTSGSTGIPKGVILSHPVVLNRLQWQWKTFPFEDNEVCCFKTVLTFVDSVAEIFGPLLQGHQLVVVPQSVVQDPSLIVAELERRGTNRLVMVPSLLRSLLSFANRKRNANGASYHSILPRLRLWVTSGEPLTEELLRDFFHTFPTGKALCNFYGCTEVMGDVTYAMFGSMNDVDKTVVMNKVPIGVPISNTTIYIMDEERRILPLGDKGEIYISGLNVSSGYLGKNATGENQRFSPNNNFCSPGHNILYRTGDYGRIAHGNIYYEGRTDTQIKIRGRRVDLAEIEQVASNIPGVNKAIVLCHHSGQPTQSVILFYQPAKSATNNLYVTEEEVTSQLHQRVVSYMVPRVIKVEELPYLHNGKVDRQNLLHRYEKLTSSTWRIEFDLSGVETDEMHMASVLLTVTSRVILGSSNGRWGAPGKTNSALTVDANFFAIGGHSLNALEVLARLHDHGYCISVADFLQAPSLRHVLHKMSVNYDLNSRTAIEQGPLDNDDTFHFVPLAETDADLGKNLVIECFMQKGDLERLTKPTYDEYLITMDGWWPFAIKSGLSFSVTDANNRLLAVSLNFADYFIPDTKEAPSLQCMTDFITDIEEPHVARLPSTPGTVVHAAMLTTDYRLLPTDNIRLVCLMEEHGIRVAKQLGYKVIITTNATELTKDVCVELLGYEVMERVQVNQYRDSKDQRVFAAAPDDYFVYICVKFL